MVMVKLGGSLITDKGRAWTARYEVIARLAREVRQAIDILPGLTILLGHGSGSFGHWAAAPYGTRLGVHTSAQWRGYAEVSAAAARLNRIVTDAFLEAGVPVLSLQPSASARCCDGVLEYLDTRPIQAALSHGLVPLVYGDVAFDAVRGGTIISTEDIFIFLARALDTPRPTRILLLGEVDGVLDEKGTVIPHISPPDLPALRAVLGGAQGVDVTGGMVDKVTRMLELVREYPEIQVHIMNGKSPGLLTCALLGERTPGTCISG
ncbi:MAG: isopentenyl phosphate kinase [Anaerolineae bacterium]|nr:isopentenyl phosphate kinase [Anaerolineae bacterium]